MAPASGERKLREHSAGSAELDLEGWLGGITPDPDARLERLHGEARLPFSNDA